ncbi:hypothetical protein J6590_030737 [Homalodisca vitripennis]|nr:hypothetical protein J6590_030737 [Homalodisca vitripennis]
MDKTGPTRGAAAAEAVTTRDECWERQFSLCRVQCRSVILCGRVASVSVVERSVWWLLGNAASVQEPEKKSSGFFSSFGNIFTPVLFQDPLRIPRAEPS